MEKLRTLLERAQRLAPQEGDLTHVLALAIEELENTADAELERISKAAEAACAEYLVVTLTAHPGAFWDSAEVEQFRSINDCSPIREENNPSARGWIGGGGTSYGALSGAQSGLEPTTAPAVRPAA